MGPAQFSTLDTVELEPRLFRKSEFVLRVSEMDYQDLAVCYLSEA